MINVIVNGKNIKIKEGMPLASFLASRRPEGSPTVVELNGKIIRKPDFASTVLKDGDRIEVVTLVGGG